MDLDVSKEAKEPQQQPLGLVPLYPFPPLQTQSTDKSKNSLQIPNFGFTFLPPIYQKAHHYGSRTYFTDDQLKFEAQEMLLEVITEEALNLLEEVIIEGTKPSPRAIKQHAQQEKHQHDRTCKEIVYNLINDVVKEECYNGVISFYDDLIVDHRNKSEHDEIGQDVIEAIEMEVIADIASEVYESCICGEICLSIIHELVCEEAKVIAKNALMHYGARVAFSQFKSISKCAADFVMDSMCVQSLLPTPTSPSAPTSNVLDHMMFEVLLLRAIQMENEQQEHCFPLKWYKRKAVLNIAMDIAMDVLEESFAFELT